VSSFAKYLAKDFGTNPNPVITAPGCAQQVVCKPTLSATVMPACVAANDFMQLKNDLRGAKTFKCSLFTDAAGAKCDIKDMTLLPSGLYANDCTRTDGTLMDYTYDCTLDEFTVLVQGYDARIQKVFARLDKSAKSTMNQITVDMKSLVDTQVIDKISEFADGVTCGFLGKSYRKFVRSACYAGGVGFIEIYQAYVASGVLTLVLVIIMYFVWRIAVDNFNTNGQGPAGASPAEAGETPQASPEEVADPEKGVVPPPPVEENPALGSNEVAPAPQAEAPPAASQADAAPIQSPRPVEVKNGVESVELGALGAGAGAGALVGMAATSTAEQPAKNEQGSGVGLQAEQAKDALEQIGMTPAGFSSVENIELAGDVAPFTPSRDLGANPPGNSWLACCAAQPVDGAGESQEVVFKNSA